MWALGKSPKRLKTGLNKSVFGRLSRKFKPWSDSEKLLHSFGRPALGILVDTDCAEASFLRALIAQVFHCQAHSNPKENVEAQLKLLEKSSQRGFAPASHELAHFHANFFPVFLSKGWLKNLSY